MSILQQLALISCPIVVSQQQRTVVGEMSTVNVERVLPHDLETVWPVLADIGGIHRFHPLVAKSPNNPATPKTGMGAERTCHFHDGNQVVERVVGFEDRRRIEIAIVEGTMPIEDARAVMELEPMAGGKTKISFEMHYTPKFGIVGRAMDAVIIRRKFTSILGQVLEALDEHLTTGKLIDKDWRPKKAA